MCRVKHGWHCLAAGAALALVTVVLVQLFRPAPVLEGAGPPELPAGTAVARRASDGVDVVMWDGGEWRTVLPTSAIPPLTFGAGTFAPRIASVLVSPDRTRLGLWVVFCDAAVSERDSCTARGYVYHIAQGALLELGMDVAPVAWLAGGRLLVEDFAVGFGAVFDPSSGRSVPLPGPDEPCALSSLPDGASADGDRVLFSGETGDGFVSRSTGTVTAFEGVMAHNTTWMAFDPTGLMAAIVRIRPGEDNRLGGGALQLFDARGALTETVSMGQDGLDFNPAWSDDGVRLAFLRGDAAALRRDAQAAGTDGEDLPAGLLVYDLATRTTRQVLGPDVVRRGLIVPGAGDVALLLQPLAGRPAAHWLHLDGGPPLALLDDGREHTAIGAVR